jgi:putative transcriptional regulator
MSDLPTLDDLLMAHAAGQLPEAVALLVATHLTLSPQSGQRYRLYEAVGGALLDEIDPAPMSDAALDRTLARLEVAAPADVPAPLSPASRWPAPLSHYLPEDGRRLRWRWYGPLVEATVPVDSPGHRVRLYRLKAGWGVPYHTHRGQELTLVLDGAFRHAGGHYGKGDVEIADDSINHRPVAEPGQDCFCLAVTQAPVRLTGRFLRWFNPLVPR